MKKVLVKLEFGSGTSCNRKMAKHKNQKNPPMYAGRVRDHMNSYSPDYHEGIFG